MIRRLLDTQDLSKAFPRVHFVGIGGAGMSGIAEVLCTLGYQVSGSDNADNVVTRRLASLGATVCRGHAAANVLGSVLGAHMALRHGAGFVRTLFIAVVGLLILKTGYDAFLR